ncbi:MAG: putative aldolase [Pseudonocardia sp.]|nr:putative aldolase [Pseudonocardia sp.]
MSYPSGDVRDQLAHVGAEAVRSGLVVGSGGNLSAREPGADACWVTAADTWLDRLDRREFSLLRISDGTVLDGHPNPSSEWRLHTHTYLARPDVNALVHLHPQTSVLLAALGHPIRLVTTDHCFYVREVVVRPYVQPGTDDLAQDAADAVSDGANAVILGHHGCSVLGETVELAHKRAFNLEEAARTTALAIMLGAPADAIPACPPGYVEAMLRGTVTR